MSAIQEAARFSERLMHEGEYLQFSYLGKGRPKPEFILTRGPADLDRIPEEKEGVGLFFGVAMRDTTRGRKEDLGHVKAVWVDVDGKTAMYVLERCKQLRIPHPTFVVASGHGCHLYWVLKEPLDMRIKEELEKLERVNKHLMKRLGGDPQAVNANRLMRVPGTNNYKAATVPVTLLYSGLEDYELKEIAPPEVLKAPPQRPFTGEPVKIGRMESYPWVKVLCEPPEHAHDEALVTLSLMLKSKEMKVSEAMKWLGARWSPQGRCSSPSHRCGPEMRRRLGNLWASPVRWSTKRTWELLESWGHLDGRLGVWRAMERFRKDPRRCVTERRL